MSWPQELPVFVSTAVHMMALATTALETPILRPSEIDLQN